MNTRKQRLIIPILVLGLVAVFGACSSGGDDKAADAESEGSAPAAATEEASGGTVSVTAEDIKFVETELSSAAGPVAIELVNKGQAPHTLVIDGQDFKLEAAAGASASGTAELAAGTYSFYCDVPGHRDAGMEGTLTVS